MEKIELKEVLPAAFAAGGPAVLRSEIWRREVTFRRGEFCLVEAASGAGKSSLCSFLYGIRGDYAGRILFDGVDCRTLSRAAYSSNKRFICTASSLTRGHVLTKYCGKSLHNTHGIAAFACI